MVLIRDRQQCAAFIASIVFALFLGSPNASALAPAKKNAAGDVIRTIELKNGRTVQLGDKRARKNTNGILDKVPLSSNTPVQIEIRVEQNQQQRVI